jgi:two-component system cell cycle sensor histidine kinase/response regulator CckA
MNSDRRQLSRWSRLRSVVGIRARLAILVFVAIVPMVGLVTSHFANERARARVSAERRTAEVARLVAQRADEFVERMRVILEASSMQVRRRRSELAYNDSILAELASRTLSPSSLLNAIDADGNLLGSSYRKPDRTTTNLGRGRRYIDEVRRTHRFAVGEPVLSRLDSTRWIASFAVPLLDRNGTLEGNVLSTVWLDSLGPMLDPGTLPERSVATVIDRDGAVVYRSLAPTRFIGRDVSKAPGNAELLGKESGVRVGVSALDGEERVVAWQRLKGAPWTVTVGIPIDAMMIAETHDLERDVFVLFATIVLALFAAALIAGRIVRPIQTLTTDAASIAGGDLSHRTTVTTGGELGVLARQFNAMAETLELQTRSLRDNEERYRELFELSPLPTWLFDEATLRFIAVNDAMTQTYGWSREELLAMSTIQIRPAENVDAYKSLFRGSGDPSFSQHRVRHLARDGTLLDVEISSARTEFSGHRAWLVVANDLTQRERIEAALRTSQEQLRQMQKIEAVGSLAAGIAHDFNNLLTGILGSIDLALLALPQSHPAVEEVSHAREAAMRATELTKRLLMFSRQQTTQSVVVDLRETVRGMQPLLARTLGEQVRLDLRLGRGPCTVLGDPGQLEQVLLNLLVNARDAMPDGGVATIDVRPAVLEHAVEGVPAGSWVTLSVSDTGTGIDPATMARVFEPFFTTKERGKGTGLGLSVVFSIVTNANGFVRLDTAAGAGATFRLYFPMYAGTPAPRVSPARGAVSAVGAETILLVEDDDAVRRVTRRMLEGCGYTVLDAAGPRQALDLARDHIGTIHLVLTDVIMPGMNGRELVEAILKLRPGLRVVYASGYTDDVALLSQLRSQALFFLQKPFNSEGLSRIVRSALDAEESER